MEIFWAVIVVAMLTIYIILDGFDMGAGIIHLLFAKTEEEKKKITGAIGPFWDGNEVWLLAGGGVLVFAFPTLYAVGFSGFYLPLIMILWLLMFRGIGLELRNLLNNSMWKTIWDKAFGLSSLMLTIFFGAALGNVVRGVNLGGVENGVSIYEGHYFFAPLWTSFSPTDINVGVLDWFTVLMGLLAAVTLTTHAATWLRYKLSGDINDKMKKIIPYSLRTQIVLIIVTVLLLFVLKPEPFKNFTETPLFIVFPVISILSLVAICYNTKKDNEGWAFISSALFILGSFLTTIMSMFPVLLPSTNNVNPSLTIEGMAAPAYGLEVGIYWWTFGMIFVIGYFIFIHKVFAGKLDDMTYDH